jgi:excisionase family DNA binding protein
LNDYENRSYLSAIEAAKFLGISVNKVHELVRKGTIEADKSASGQYRFDIENLKDIEINVMKKNESSKVPDSNLLKLNSTTQELHVKNSQYMTELEDDSINLMITSPPYFNTKMYSKEPIENDLGNIHDLEMWFDEIQKVWSEVHRVLQPGRKAFINIMNLPVRTKSGFRSYNLVGRTIDVCEELGFIFKRDIVWQKTNSVRAHFGTYPFPGGILLNYAHEFILEFEKPAPKNYSKYNHLTKEQKERSKLDKKFWLSLKKSDVWLMKPEGSGDQRNHVAPFPYELPYRVIKAYSYVDETVLDPFLGWGATLVAARDLGRNGVGYEINPGIVQEAIKRLKS